MKYILLTVPERKHKPTPHNAEFGRAGKANSLINQAFCQLVRADSEFRKPGMLVKHMMEILRADRQHAWGERTVQNGAIEMLEGFDFNKKRLLCQLPVQLKTDINAVTGICSISLSSFNPDAHYIDCGRATHLRFSAAAACLDFKNQTYSSQTIHSHYLPFKKEVQLKLTPMVNVGDGHPILLLFGVGFYQEINREHFSLKAGGGPCLHIVQTARGIAEP